MIIFYLFIQLENAFIPSDLILSICKVYILSKLCLIMKTDSNEWKRKHVPYKHYFYSCWFRIVFKKLLYRFEKFQFIEKSCGVTVK